MSEWATHCQTLILPSHTFAEQSAVRESLRARLLAYSGRRFHDFYSWARVKKNHDGLVNPAPKNSQIALNNFLVRQTAPWLLGKFPLGPLAAKIVKMKVRNCGYINIFRNGKIE